MSVISGPAGHEEMARSIDDRGHGAIRGTLTGPLQRVHDFIELVICHRSVAVSVREARATKMN
jgi:hypothetical protein